MKKLIFRLIGLVVICLYFGCKPGKTTEDAVKAKICFKTLNGFDGNKAGRMIQHFLDLKGNDLKPQGTSVWFDKKVIYSVDSLLQAEYQVSKGQKDSTDGMRIYFATDL